MIKLTKSKQGYKLTIYGKKIEILDADKSFVLARCELADLDGVSMNSFPEKLMIEVDNPNRFKTNIFDEVTVSKEGNVTTLDFTCRLYNKYWEQFFGLTAYISAIDKQVKQSDCFEVTDFDLGDPWKSITVSRDLSDVDLITPAILNTARELHMLEETALRALANEAVKLFSNNV